MHYNFSSDSQSNGIHHGSGFTSVVLPDNLQFQQASITVGTPKTIAEPNYTIFIGLAIMTLFILNSK